MLQFPTEIYTKIDTLVDGWNATPVHHHIEELESMAQGVFLGDSVPVTIQKILLEYTEWLYANQGLLDSVFDGEALLQAFLERESRKVLRIEEIEDRLKGYTFGVLDPRYRKLKKEQESLFLEISESRNKYERTGSTPRLPDQKS